MDSLETRTVSIRQMRQERLQADTRAKQAESQAAALRVQLDKALRELKEAEAHLDTANKELHVTLKRYFDNRTQHLNNGPATNPCDTCTVIAGQNMLNRKLQHCVSNLTQ